MNANLVTARHGSRVEDGFESSPEAMVALGARWYDKHKHDVHYARDGVIQPGGFRTKPPRYYDQRLEKTDQRQALKITNERIKQAKTRSKDNTEQRLETKEKVAIANQSRKQRMKI